MKKIFLVPFFILTIQLFSQEEIDTAYLSSDSVKLIVATAECDIIFADGRELKNVRISGIEDTMFSVTKGVSVTRTFPLNSVKKITFYKHGFWKGFAIGTGATLALGIILTLTEGKGEGHPSFKGIAFLLSAIACIPVGIVTGLISELATDNDVYAFPGNNTEAKIKRLKYIMYKEKDN